MVSQVLGSQFQEGPSSCPYHHVTQQRAGEGSGGRDKGEWKGDNASFIWPNTQADSHRIKPALCFSLRP